MKLKVKLFDIYIFLMTLFKALGFDSSSKIYIAVLAVGCAAILMKLYTESFSLKEIISMVFLVAIGLAVWLRGDFSSVLTTAVALCGLKNVDAKRVIKISFWTRVAVFISLLIGILFGFVKDEIYKVYRNGSYIERHCLGHHHPNEAHMMFAIMVLLAIYLYGHKMELAHYFAIILFNQILFAFTYSRTGWLVTLFSPLCFALLKGKKTRPITMWICKHMYLVLCGLTLFVGIAYERISLLKMIDTVVAGRFYYINLLLTTEPVQLIGTVIKSSVIIDNGYLELLYKCGVIFFLWFSYYYVKITRKLYNEGRYNELLLITCMAIYNLSESFFELISVNVALVFFGEVLFRNTSRTSTWKKSQYLHQPTIEEK